MRSIAASAIADVRSQFANTGAFALSTLLTVLLSYASFAVCARALSPNDFGLLGALLAILSVASVSLRPLHTAATHLAADALEDDPRRVASLNASAIGSVAIAWIAVSVLVFALQDQWSRALRVDTTAALQLLVLMIAGTALWQVSSGHLLGLHLFRQYSLAATIDPAMRLALVLPLILTWGVDGAVAAYTVGVFVSASLGIALTGGLKWTLRGPSWIGQFASLGMASFALTLTIVLLQNLDLVVLRTYAGPIDVGWYAGAAALGNAGFTLAAPLYLPLYARVRAAHIAGTDAHHLLAGPVALVLVGGMSTAALLVPVGTPLAALLLGASLANAGAYLPGYAVKITGLVILFMVGQFALATDRRRAALLPMLPGLISIVLLVLVQPDTPAVLLFPIGGAVIGTALTALALRTRRAR